MMTKFLLVLFIFVQSLFAQSIIIGKYDRIDLPVLNMENLRSKIDTGAKTSSLHCRYIEEIPGNKVVFDVLDKTHKKYENVKYTMPIKRIATVRSSNGLVENRYVISTKVFIFEKEYEVEFTLRNRKKMDYPILLGREFLKQGFIVDVREEDLSFLEKSN